jgi:hypothetical protein
MLVEWGPPAQGPAVTPGSCVILDGDSAATAAETLVVRPGSDPGSPALRRLT